MNAATIAALLAQFGPGAIGLIEKLISVWSKPALSVEEVTEITDLAKKSYESYVPASKLPPTA